jgi:hypothetical protein
LGAEVLREAQRDFEPRMRALARIQVNDDGFVAHCKAPEVDEWGTTV